MSSKLQRAVFAEKPVLDQHHCEAITSNHLLTALDPQCPLVLAEGSAADVLRHSSGWKFHSFHRHILHEQEIRNFLQGIKRQLLADFPSISAGLANESKSTEAWVGNDHLHVEGFHLHVPPMLFGADLMLLQAPNGQCLNISAMDAVYSWVAQHTAERMAVQPLSVPKVPFSHGWMAAMRSTLEDSNSTRSAASPLLPHQSGKYSDSSPLPDEAAILTAVRAYDWTFSNDYCLTLLSADSKAILSARSLSSPKGWQITRTESCLIDYEVLKRRDLPILFYDELLLYQDDLEDCGEVSMEAKLRVMPGCWFLLSKLFLRVDQKLVRSRETRLFHEFTSDGQLVLQMEVVWREVTYETSIDPRGAVPYAKSCTKEMSGSLLCVNEQEGVHQFYTLTYSG